jgi:SAM-dependent methyltransferase
MPLRAGTDSLILKSTHTREKVEIITGGDADLVFLAREFLGEPNCITDGSVVERDVGCHWRGLGPPVSSLGDQAALALAAQSCRQWHPARRLTPQIEFRQGDMLALDVPDESWAGIAAFYSIIHIRRSDLPQALGELRRVLRPGGLLLLAFHLGSDTVHLDEWWGHPVSVDFFFFQSEEMATYLRAAGFEIEEIIERDPYPDVEHPSRRGYIFARRDAQAL